MLVQREIDWRAGRGLDRHLVTALAEGDWIRHGRNVLITGATGTGKTWLGCALAQQAARQGFSVLLHPRHKAAAGAAGGPRRRQLRPAAGPTGVAGRAGAR